MVIFGILLIRSVIKEVKQREELEELTEKYLRANKKLKELDNLKDEFVSIASHELRTPMTAVKSYLWMAINQPGQKIEPTLAKYLDICYASTERLIRLVNDMLTVSRIERNKIELKLATIDMYEVAELVYNELKVTADQNHIIFALSREDKKPYLVDGDKDKLREVIQNIVGNALKFTPAKGHIKVHFSKTRDCVHIAVSDTGPGIPKESMGLLFQKFQKIDYSYAKHSNQPGTGLGLYISKQIVSLHKGSIEVQSEVGVGTTFTVSLPLAG
jgi:signal transduction histidine kinase